jgi:predicted DNA-binding transcriptional regulator YafY
VTARELAEEFGVTPRQIRRIIAEPRAEFLARAAERRETAARLRAAGLSYAECAAEMSTTPAVVRRLMADAWKAAERNAVPSAG